MSRLSEEMRIIPQVAWGIAVVCYLFFALFSWNFIIPNDPDIPTWPMVFKILFSLVVPAFLGIWVLLIGYVNGDARRRGMRHVMWTLLAIFIPNAIGIILYFVMRDPPMRTCASCGSSVRGGFAFCPACGAAAAKSCPNCRKPIEAGWAHCPSCGQGLKAA